MKRVIQCLTASLLIVPAFSYCQKKITLETEFSALYNISDLPTYRKNTVEEEETTYDRSGGNDDGFHGTYSFIRKNPGGGLVMLDIKGPGVINRFATPTPGTDTLDFYIDDTLHPTFSIRYRDLFNKNIFPFVSPLCDTAAGGYYCYFPILFQKSCRIIYRGERLQFHQIQYRLFPPGTIVKSFSMSLSNQEKIALNEIKNLWAQTPKSALDFAPNSKTITTNFQLQPGKTKTCAYFNNGGRITGIEIQHPELTQDSAKNIWLRITWDGSQTPAVDCPLADFFGYAFGVPSMRGLLAGHDQSSDYCYFPMPFDKSAKIELINNGAEKTISFQTKISFSESKRDPEKEGEFFAAWKTDSLTTKDPYHVFLNLQGRGHYVGTILQSKGLLDHGTPFFEGDDSTAIDGVFRMHGTGSEDYFNGGWYDVKGRWDTARSKPLSGCLLYSSARSMTGGYRFFLSDKIPFEKSFFHAIEHGGYPNYPIAAIYTSVSFYYADPRVSKTAR